MRVDPAVKPYFAEEWLQIKCLREWDLRRPFAAGLCFQLILITSGAGIVELNQQRVPVASPAVFCMDERETVRLVSLASITAQAIHFHPAWINPLFTFANLWAGGPAMDSAPHFIQDRYFLTPFLDRESGYHGILSCAPEVFLRLRELYVAAERQLTARPDYFWPCRSRSYLLQLLIVISNLFSQRVETAPRPDAPSPDPAAFIAGTDQLVEMVITYLHSNYPEDIQLSDLERRFITNRTSLSDRFKKATGQTLMNYLRGLRLKVAASLLKETVIPIYEICERVGFNDLSHFGRSFRGVYSLTPSEYRAKFCWLEKPG